MYRFCLVTNQADTTAAAQKVRPHRFRRPRLAKMVVRLVLCVLVILLAATARLFLWPSTDEPGRVDAVVVLSGDYGERIRRALELMADGVAPTLVHAGTPDSAQVLELCAGGQPFEVVCPMPDPDSTRAEARAVSRLAETRGWSSMAVVTSNFHVTRAGMLFRRCFDGELKMVGAPSSFSLGIWRKQLTHEWVGAAHSLVVGRNC